MVIRSFDEQYRCTLTRFQVIVPNLSQGVKHSWRITGCTLNSGSQNILQSQLSENVNMPQAKINRLSRNAIIIHNIRCVVPFLPPYFEIRTCLGPKWHHKLKPRHISIDTGTIIRLFHLILIQLQVNLLAYIEAQLNPKL